MSFANVAMPFEMRSDSDANVFGDNDSMLQLKVASNVTYLHQSAAAVAKYVCEGVFILLAAGDQCLLRCSPLINVCGRKGITVIATSVHR